MRRDVVAIYKWWGETGKFSIQTSRIGLPPAPEYVGFDFWANKFIPPFKDMLSVVLENDSCCCIAVRPSSNVPQLISTSRHVTQGIVDVTEETWDSGSQTLSGVSSVVGNDLYELRIVMPSGETWQEKEVVLSIADVQAGIKAGMTKDGSNLRITLNSASSRLVHWSVRFATR